MSSETEASRLTRAEKWMVFFFAAMSMAVILEWLFWLSDRIYGGSAQGGRYVTASLLPGLLYFIGHPVAAVFGIILINRSHRFGLERLERVAVFVATAYFSIVGGFLVVSVVLGVLAVLS